MKEEAGPRRCGGNHVPTTKPKFTRAPPGIPLPPQIRSHVAVTLVHRAFAHIISQISKMSPRDIERPGSPAPKKLMTARLANYVPRSVTAASPHAAIARERGSLVSMLTVGTVTSLFLATWLEQQIKLLNPDFDLTKGPSVNLGENELTLQSSSGVLDCSNAVTMLETETQSRDKPATRKRPYDLVEDPETDQTPRAEASSVANAFGMLSLHSDSRQQHYMGSSSGLLFTKLIGVDRDTQISSPSSYSETSKYGRHSISQSLKQGYRSLYQSLARELPSPEEAEVLLAVYFQHIHIDYPVLHAPSLINAYLALYESTQMEPTGQYDSNGWMEGLEPFEYNGMADKESGKQSTPITVFTAVVHVFMVFSLAATVLTRKKNFDYSPTKFYRMALAETSSCFSSVSVTSLQGILLLAIHSMICPAGLNIWTLAHLAMSHCIDLGLHREPSPSTSVSRTSLAVKRLIFYTTYSLDRTIATIQGRPLGIRDETFDIQRPEVEDVTEDLSSLADCKLNVSAPSSAHMTMSIRRFRLDQYITEIKLLFYHLPKQLRPLVWPNDLENHQAQIKLDLDAWLTETSLIQPPTDREEDRKSVQYEKLRLEILYHSAVTLLFQPSQTFRSPSPSALRHCYQSCSRKLRIYDHLSTEEQLYYNWRNIHGIFSSGATLIYCIWASPSLQATIPFAEVLRDLRTCSNLLSIGGQWWPSVRNGKGSFDKMVDLTIRQLSRTQTSTPQTRRSLQTQHTEISCQPDLGHSNLVPGYSSTRGVQPTEVPSSHPLPNEEFPDPTGDHLDLDFGEPGLLFSNPIGMDVTDTYSIDSAMESFLAEFVRGDWGWDPFSGTTAL
ncbi:positive regulator of purine utilization [Aspergillus awamori]|uniref:Positive regulator of purine utilization n=1 Tax=Aspergillus awamori TaxID=105351 RepID=A0A401L085_ASPAW|nr:positive regulator of purine utilization [Aspergillus awamori]